MNRLFGRLVKGIELERALINRLRKRAERGDLSARKSGLAEMFLRHLEKGCWLKRLHTRQHPSPNGVGARDGKLLSHDDAGEPLEALGPLAKRRVAGERVHARQMRASAGQRGQAFLDVGDTSDPAHLLVVAAPPLDARTSPGQI